jgi:tetratricopeptide (TPR) repeat protein
MIGQEASLFVQSVIDDALEKVVKKVVVGEQDDNIAAAIIQLLFRRWQYRLSGAAPTTASVHENLKRYPYRGCSCSSSCKKSSTTSSSSSSTASNVENSCRNRHSSPFSLDSRAILELFADDGGPGERSPMCAGGDSKGLRERLDRHCKAAARVHIGSPWLGKRGANCRIRGTCGRGAGTSHPPTQPSLLKQHLARRARQARQRWRQQQARMTTMTEALRSQQTTLNIHSDDMLQSLLLVHTVASTKTRQKASTSTEHIHQLLDYVTRSAHCRSQATAAHRSTGRQMEGVENGCSICQNLLSSLEDHSVVADDESWANARFCYVCRPETSTQGHNGRGGEEESMSPLAQALLDKPAISWEDDGSGEGGAAALHCGAKAQQALSPSVFNFISRTSSVPSDVASELAQHLDSFEKWPMDLPRTCNFALFLTRHGLYSEALEVVQHAIDVATGEGAGNLLCCRPQPIFMLYKVARTLSVACGKFGAAASFMRSAVEVDVNRSAALTEAGNFMEGIGDPGAAEALYLASLLVDPRHVPCLLAYAQLLSRTQFHLDMAHRYLIRAEQSSQNPSDKALAQTLQLEMLLAANAVPQSSEPHFNIYSDLFLQQVEGERLFRQALGVCEAGCGGDKSTEETRQRFAACYLSLARYEMLRHGSAQRASALLDVSLQLDALNATTLLHRACCDMVLSRGAELQEKKALLGKAHRAFHVALFSQTDSVTWEELLLCASFAASSLRDAKFTEMVIRQAVAREKSSKSPSALPLIALLHVQTENGLLSEEEIGKGWDALSCTFPESATSLTALGWWKLRQENVRGALEIFQEAIELDASNRCMRSCAMRGAAVALLRSDSGSRSNWERACSLLSSGAATAMGSPLVAILRTWAMALHVGVGGRLRQPMEALDIMKRAVDLEPNHTSTACCLSLMLLESGAEEEQCLELLDKAFRSSDGDYLPIPRGALLVRAQAYQALGDEHVKKAERCFQLALEAYPHDALVMARYAQFLLSQRGTGYAPEEQYTDILDRLLRKNDASSESLFLTAMLLNQDNTRQQAACELLIKASKGSPSSKGTFSSLYLMGKMAVSLGDYKGAEEKFLAAMDADPVTTGGIVAYEQMVKQVKHDLCRFRKQTEKANARVRRGGLKVAKRAMQRLRHAQKSKRVSRCHVFHSLARMPPTKRQKCFFPQSYLNHLKSTQSSSRSY